MLPQNWSERVINQSSDDNASSICWKLLKAGVGDIDGNHEARVTSEETIAAPALRVYLAYELKNNPLAGCQRLFLEQQINFKQFNLHNFLTVYVASMYSF